VSDLPKLSGAKRERGSAKRIANGPDANKMVVIALLTLDIHIPHAQSLKDKRMVVRSLKDRLRTKFNVAVAEVDHQDLWQRSQISVVAVGSDGQFLQKMLEGAAEEAERIAPECSIQTNIEIV
jgi:uncharacterized protein YlxP (DUF503 family)